MKEKIAQYRNQGRFGGGGDGDSEAGGCGGLSTLDGASTIEPGCAGLERSSDDPLGEHSAEIQEIDSRLQALQEFLRSARAANGQV